MKTISLLDLPQERCVVDCIELGYISKEFTEDQLRLEIKRISSMRPLTRWEAEIIYRKLLTLNRLLTLVELD